MFFESKQKGIELCISVKQRKKKKHEPLWFFNKVKKAISKKRQVMGRFKETPTASEKTRFLKTGQKTVCTVKEA